MEIYEYTTQMQLKSTYPDEQVFRIRNLDTCKDKISHYWINFEHVVKNKKINNRPIRYSKLSVLNYLTFFKFIGNYKIVQSSYAPTKA